MSKQTLRWVGVDRHLKILNSELALLKGKNIKGLFKAGLLLYSESAKEVPVRTGDLLASEYIRGAIRPKPRVEVGYTAAHAPFVHENPRAGRTGGVSPSGKKYYSPRTTSGAKGKAKAFATVGKWKFLEDPLKRIAGRMKLIIAKEALISSKKIQPRSFYKKGGQK